MNTLLRRTAGIAAAAVAGAALTAGTVSADTIDDHSSRLSATPSTATTAYDVADVTLPWTGCTTVGFNIGLGSGLPGWYSVNASVYDDAGRYIGGGFWTGEEYNPEAPNGGVVNIGEQAGARVCPRPGDTITAVVNADWSEEICSFNVACWNPDGGRILGRRYDGTLIHEGAWVYPGPSNKLYNSHDYSATKTASITFKLPSKTTAAAASRVKVGRTVTITGKSSHRTTTGRTTPNKKVTLRLQYHPKNSNTWTTIGSVTTRTNGTYTATTRATKDGYYRTVYKGTSTIKGSGSPARYVDVTS